MRREALVSFYFSGETDVNIRSCHGSAGHMVPGKKNTRGSAISDVRMADDMRNFWEDQF